MASAEHVALAAVVRNVHRDLRNRYKQNSGGENGMKYDDQLWSEHCQNVDVLCRYADAMHRLATVHWTANNVSTRIDWCYLVIKKYFHDGGMAHELARYLRRSEKNRSSLEHNANNCSGNEVRCSTKPRVLDVGSCYNPFSVYDDLDVLGLDLHPATSDVRKCDFLNLDVTDAPGEEVNMATAKDEIVRRLPARRFDVVVFSLSLEYLPRPMQRFRCFVTASALLSLHGLLLIVTPDSKHQARNSAMIKSWRLGLESLGFHRMTYEKQTHLHCMAFVKVADVTPLLPELVIEKQLAERFYIPQDFQEFVRDEQPPSVCRTDIDNVSLVAAFSELPEYECHE